MEIGGLSGTSGAVTVTISFSEDVTGFTVEDIAVSNGAVSNFAGSGAAYTATITPAEGGMVTSLVIAAGAAADAANNGNKRATANNATVSRLAAPAPLTATPGDGRVALSWTVTADNTGFAAATRYQYRSWATGGSFTEWTDVPDNDGDGDLSDETAHVVAGLANGVNHLFQVRAVNGAGVGAPASVTAMPSAAGDTTAPTVVSIKRRTPSTSPTSADSLTWRVTFSESVTGVDGADFTVTGSTATAAAADSSAGVVWDVTASGGDLESLEGAVTLGFASGQDIADASGNALDPTLPAGAETAYTVDNTPDRPTGADRTVTTNEDTAYAFTADDFGFVDADEGDTLAGIRITALETAGALKFSADVTLDQVISKAEIDTGLLTFTPAANANGPGYATFGFKVSDGALESAAANTITIDVTAVNDAPTGLPAIAGIPSEGDTLTAATDAIADADGLGTFGYQWKRDGTAIAGATSSTYTLAQADVGSAITVTVSWTDDGGTAESATSAPTAMVTLAPLTVTLDTGLGGVLETDGPVTVTITFSAAVTGFAETDLAAVRGTVSDFTEVTSGTVWTVRLTPNPDFNGRNVILTVPAGAAMDANGNGNKRAGTSVRYLAPLRAPRDHTATPGDARATLAWTAPANDGVGLAAVSKYQYQYHPAGGPWVWWRDVPDGDGDGDFSDETSFTLGGLQNGTRYHFRLRALNGAGEGAATAIFSTVPSANTATDGVTVSESSLALTEGHASDAEGSYTVALDTDPGATVSIAVSSDDASAATVSPSTLTFTGGDSGTWGTAQEVTVTAQEDGDAAGETVTVSHAATVSSDSSNPYHQITVADVSVTLTDAGHGVLVSESSLAVNAGASATYKLRLKSQPGGSVVIAPTSSSTAGATVSPATLTFTNANWDQEQTVTVTGVGGATTGTATVSHAITTATTAYPATQSIASVAVTLRNLTLDPTTIPANSLNGATVTLIPKNMSFIGAGSGTGQRDSNSANWAEDDEGNPIIGQLSARAKALFTLSGAPDGLTISDVELLARETGVHGMPAGVGHRSARITLAYSGSAVTMDETVTVSVASEHFREYAGTSFRGFDLDAPSFSASFTISPGSTTNAAPTAANGAVTVDEDGTHTFAAADFSFMDADTGDTLASVRITTLETAGDLEVDGTDATLDQVVTKADIDANKLTFAPAADANGAAYATFGFKVNDGTDDSAAAYVMTVNVTAVNDAPAGLPTITGTASRGQTLTADTSGISDADGLGTFAYQWKRGGTDIAGETASTYTVALADVGSTLAVTVSWTDQDGTAESLTSAATAEVTNVNTAPTGRPTITGTPEQGQTLTANRGDLADADGLPSTTFPAGYGFQWKRGGTDITGATSRTYALVQADVGSTITVAVSYTDGGDTAESVDSAATGTVANVNDAPEFGSATLTRSVAENSASGTNVGAVIPAATDDDGDSLTYTLEGTDAASFDFDASTRQISAASGVAYDHEAAKNSYSVTVKADDSNGGTDTVAVTVNVSDEDEPPSAPGAPSVAATTDSTTSLDVSWTAPANTGRPAIS
ncbi:MAG: Ig-like domain-containing protein, partial [Gammaproteobacteria bacterium]|nr:Ig-like domain-containing protein [Gammaproteobacteria bacterium]